MASTSTATPHTSHALHTNAHLHLKNVYVKAMQFADKLAFVMDDLFTIPGTNRKVGLDGIIGLIPGVGDLISTLITAVLIWQAWTLGIDVSFIYAMLKNMLINFVVGLIPIFGDIFAILFKCSSRNKTLLRRGLLDKIKAKKAEKDAYNSPGDPLFG
eukprot:GILK01012717.1.p1 GENE.GILK01012717.1~~GILK01012717.1.p1  ORF type:complete len:184 (-),score=23.32 GILK01012717.1:80-550(-)